MAQQTFIGVYAVVDLSAPRVYTHVDNFQLRTQLYKFTYHFKLLKFITIFFATDDAVGAFAPFAPFNNTQ